MVRWFSMSTPHTDSRNSFSFTSKITAVLSGIKIPDDQHTSGSNKWSTLFTQIQDENFFFVIHSPKKWGVPLESHTQLKTSCMDILWSLNVLMGGSSYTWVNTAQLKTVKMMACPTDSVHVDTAYSVPETVKCDL